MLREMNLLRPRPRSEEIRDACPGGPRPPSVRLVPIGEVLPDILEFLSAALEDAFGAACEIEAEGLDPARAFDPIRRQYRAPALLAALAALGGPAGTAPAAAGKVLGVAAGDLFVPVLTFVFGQAQLGGRAALISVHRLGQEFYGLPPDPALLLRRCEKEAVHELGHSFGLVHCDRVECAMRFANSIDEVDLRPNRFCPRCEERLMVDG